MKEPLNLTVVIPAYNEFHRLASTIEEMVGHLRTAEIRFEILVSDDGSTDGTAELVGDLSERFTEIRLIRNEERRGKGHAVRIGLQEARGDRVLFCDADGATPFDQFDLLAVELDNGIDVAIGSRAKKGAGIVWDTRLHRRLLGRVYATLISSRLAEGIRDTQCGFKMFSAASAAVVADRLQADGFSFDLEIFVIARRHCFIVSEIAINWSDVPGSKVRLIRDSFRMVRDAWEIRSRDRAGFYG